MSQFTPKPRAERTAFDEIRLTVPWIEPQTPRLVEAIKTHIPYRSRKYDLGPPKSWLIWGGYQDLAIELLLEAFPDAEVPRRARRPTPAPSPIGHDAFRILHLHETAPVELIEASYRVLARINHPDHGGTNEAMQAVNGAYAALKARVAS